MSNTPKFDSLNELNSTNNIKRKGSTDEGIGNSGSIGN